MWEWWRRGGKKWSLSLLAERTVCDSDVWAFCNCNCCCWYSLKFLWVAFALGFAIDAARWLWDAGIPLFVGSTSERANASIENGWNVRRVRDNESERESHISKQTSRLAKICGCPIGTNLTIRCIMFAFKMSTFFLQLSYLHCLQAFSRRLLNLPESSFIQNGVGEWVIKNATILFYFSALFKVERLKTLDMCMHVDRNSTVH